MNKVVHCKRDRFDVYIGRPSKWGNPFEIGRDGTREEVIEKYRNYILNSPELLNDLLELQDKVLGCWCYPRACHGDILIQLLFERGNKMNLYQRYRPKSFDDMIGNEAQIASLKKILAKEDKPHAFLFVGPPGCGKTTSARIAARMLGAGEFSIKELNSADNRGIDTARQIIEQMRFTPTDGEATVYIIDEMHMATKEYQNAMLKPLEDTPEHVFFFLCTTDPQKLIAAVKSRCTEVKFNALKPEESLLLLKTVNRAEGLGVSKDILPEIVDVCEGSPRKALVILEKVAGLETPEEQKKLIASGVADEENAESIELCRLLIKEKVTWKEVMEVVSRLNMDNAESIRQAVMGYMKAVLKKTWNPRAMVVLESFTERDFFYDAESRLLITIGHILFSE